MEPSEASDLQGLKYFKRLVPLLSSLHDSGTARDGAGNRRLFFDDYAKLVLLYLFNPLIDSVRRLQEASMLPKVAKTLGIKRFSMGSFSEASAVFDPELLKAVIVELAGELRPLASDPRLSELKHLITLTDATVLAALPKLTETLYNRHRDGQAGHGWRLHTHLVLGRPVPDLIDRTGARRTGTCEERGHLLEHLEAGRCYVMDRGYQYARLFNAIHAISSSYVCRAKDNLCTQLVCKRYVPEPAQAAGVLTDTFVSISNDGKEPSDHPIRLIEVAAEVHPKRTRSKGIVPSTGKVLLLTNLLEEPAELIALLYRYRWTIELFFRMLKQLLGCRHLLSQRPAGIDIQIYCALIAAMVIHLQTGKKPNKSMLFVLGLYLAGWASEQDVLIHLNRPDRTGVKTRAKDELWKKLGY